MSIKAPRSGGHGGALSKSGIDRKATGGMGSGPKSIAMSAVLIARVPVAGRAQ